MIGSYRHREKGDPSAKPRILWEPVRASPVLWGMRLLIVLGCGVGGGFAAAYFLQYPFAFGFVLGTLFSASSAFERQIIVLEEDRIRSGCVRFPVGYLPKFWARVRKARMDRNNSVRKAHPDPANRARGVSQIDELNALPPVAAATEKDRPAN